MIDNSHTGLDKTKLVRVFQWMEEGHKVSCLNDVFMAHIKGNWHYVDMYDAIRIFQSPNPDYYIEQLDLHILV